MRSTIEEKGTETNHTNNENIGSGNAGKEKHREGEREGVEERKEERERATEK
jgi:hypothetical protein